MSPNADEKLLYALNTEGSDGIARLLRENGISNNSYHFNDEVV